MKPVGTTWPQRAVVAGSVALLIAAGALAAAANFVPWQVAVVMGATSAASGLVGAAWWERHRRRTALRHAWAEATDAGPVPDPSTTGDSLLAALNPDSEVFAFGRGGVAHVKRIVAWSGGEAPERVMLVSGDAGSGKTRLALETVRRLDHEWISAWARRGACVAAIDLAAQWRRPVLLVVDDAETYPDFVALLEAVKSVPSARVLATSRRDAEWWIRIRSELDLATDAVMPAKPQIVLDSLVPDEESQAQCFSVAVRAFARTWRVGAPRVTLVPSPAPVSRLVLDAAAAVAVHDGVSGTIDLDAALQRLFAIEEQWWQRRAADEGLPPVSVAALRQVVVAAVLLGADDLDDAVRVLRTLPRLSGAGPDLLRGLALWVRKLYPNRAGGWLNPHLPARLVEHYAAQWLIDDPDLLEAVAAAATP